MYSVLAGFIAPLFVISVGSFSNPTADPPTFWSESRADTTEYLPLEIGNSWTYITILDPPFEPPDTLDRGSYSTAEMVTVDDTLYYISPHPFSLTDTVRTDTLGRIWGRIDGRDALLFDFSLGDGETYTLDWRDFEFVVTVARDQSVRTAAGTFDDVITIGFDDPDVVDEGAGYYFARGVGIVAASGGGGDYMELHEATVGNRRIPSTAEPTPDFAIQVAAFPNPSADEITFRVMTDSPAPARILIFDLLGREVDAVDAGRCMPECTVIWKARRAAPGAYFARIEAVHRLGVASFVIAE